MQLLVVNAPSSVISTKVDQDVLQREMQKHRIHTNLPNTNEILENIVPF
jgi:hypothetical protein